MARIQTSSRPQNRRSHPRPIARPCGSFYEPLEHRVLLSHIVWANRNDPANNFADTFGANVGLAMGVVDAVIAHYDRVITNFNWSGGVTQHSLNISMRDGAADFGGQCPPGQVGLDSNGVPISANVLLGRGNDLDGDGQGDGGGWFLDPTPNDFAEFTNVVNAFVGTAANTSPAFGLRDFYSLVAHEVGHAMGMTSRSGSQWRTDLAAFASDTGVADGAGAGNLWAYQSPSVGRAVLTDSDLAGQGVIGVHSAVGGQNFVFNAQNYTSAFDVMNNTFQGVNGRRLMISNLLIGMLDDVYGYNTVWPEQFGSMYTSLDTTTGQLTLRGGAGGSNDTFRVTAMNGGYQISVNIGNDVPGTGPTDAFESFWTNAQVSSIVINAGDGNDTIEIRTLSANTPVTVNGGSGDDLIEIAIGDFDTNLQSNVTVIGGTGNDRIWINDLVDGPGGDVYTITSTTFAKPSRTVTHGSIERIQILGSDNNNTWNIESLTGDLIVEGGDGADVFHITQPSADLDSLSGRATLLGGGGADTLNLYDTGDIGADSYVFDPAGADNLNFTKPGAGNFKGILYSSMQNILLEANGGNNSFVIDEIFATNVTLRGNAGDDTLLLGNGSLEINIAVTNFRFEGGAGADAMVLDDSADTGNDTHVFNATLFQGTYSKTNDSLVVTYTGVGAVTLEASNASNTVHVNGLPAGSNLTINGHLGQDTVQIGGGDIATNVLGDVHFEAVFDGRIVFNDSTNPSVGNTYDLNGGTFAHGGRTHTFANVTKVEIEGSDQADTILARTTFSYDTIIRGNGGADLITLGGGSLAFMDNVTVWGGDGADELRLDDTTTFAPTTWTVDQGAGLPFIDLFNGNTRMTYDSIATLRLMAGPHNDTLTSIRVPMSTSLRIEGNGGADTIDVQGHPSLNPALFLPVIVDGGAGLDTVKINTDGQGGARAQFNLSQTLASLEIGASGRLKLAEGKRVIETNAANMPSSGFELDLTDGMFVRRGNGSFPFYNARVATGYNGGAWNGMAINSSFAAASPQSDGLGIARASELFNGGGGVVGGVLLAANDIVIRHALNGDANLDGTVNLLDFNRVAANFGQTGTTWSQGNFNYDNTTNLADFNLLAGNFGQAGAPDLDDPWVLVP